ncbi:MAG: hypothetical protein NTX22_00240 [Ignavibacteriales bacterium]|nr:hypothetical protein [Ignavibacteriales bacterium]
MAKLYFILFLKSSDIVVNFSFLRQGLDIADRERHYKQLFFSSPHWYAYITLFFIVVNTAWDDL